MVTVRALLVEQFYMSRLLLEVIKKVDTNHLLSKYLLKTCDQKKQGHFRPRKEGDR